MRASEPVSCWPHKPCEWRSTRQPATNSFVQRKDRWPATSQMRVQLPPLPPNSPGWPLRSRRQSEKLDKHVRLVPLAPVWPWPSGLGVRLWIAPREFDSLRSPHFHWEVAKLERHLTLNQIMRRFESSPPSQSFMRAVFNGSGYPATNREIWRFESSRPYHFRLVVQRIGHSPPKAGIPVRPRTGRPTFMEVREIQLCSANFRTERRPTGEVPGCLPG